jgi:hypothetical protein
MPRFASLTIVRPPMPQACRRAADFSFDANDVVDVARESGAESSFPKLNLFP